MKVLITAVALGLCCLCPAYADEQAAAPEQPAGILPIPAYDGGFSTRPYITGDWGGKRTEWANKGIQFDVDWVHWIDSVVDGGISNDAEFGGNFTYNLKIDLMRAGILPGAILQVRAESLVGGKSASANTGQLTPSNSAALSPTNYADPGEGYDIALSQLSYLQLFNEHFGVILGKLDLYGDGDMNEFTGGRGRTQFMNWNLSFPTASLIVPAATIGAGVVVMPNHNLQVTSLVLSGTECTDSNCFDDLDDKGGISATTVSYQYGLGGRPGGVTGSFLYMFNKDFTELDSVTFVPTQGLQTSTEEESWIVTASLWQYISVEGSHEGPVNLTNRVPDLQGWGIFGRLTFADDETNPWQTSIAAGVGGRGLVPGRPDDLFGIGYFYNDLEETRLLTRAGFEDHGQGVEGFYNLAVTQAIRFSANFQYLESVLPDVDDSVQITGRLQVLF
ncbi:MAG: carbohydrate porin [Gammaproteobacteria bacterium]